MVEVRRRKKHHHTKFASMLLWWLWLVVCSIKAHRRELHQVEVETEARLREEFLQATERARQEEEDR